MFLTSRKTSRKIIMLYQIVLFCIGILMVILNVILLASTEIVELAPVGALVGGMLIGSGLSLVALIGLWGARRSSEDGGIANNKIPKSKKISLVAYSLLMAILLGMTVAGMGVIGEEMRDENILQKFDAFWDNTSETTAVRIESWGQCCGFQDYTDRYQEPCKEYEEELGCYELMKNEYEGKLEILVGPLGVLIAVEIVGMLTGIWLLCMAWREGKDAKMVGDRQPFDQWHKAVFQ